MNQEASVLQLTLNLTEAINSKDRYQCLLRTVVSSLPCDAACLLVKKGHFLETVAFLGLTNAVKKKSFSIFEHPRLKAIINSISPIIFPYNSPLPDPFDGLIADDTHAIFNIHSCLGCPLIVEGEVIGALTVDALKPHQFDSIEKEWLKTIAALAGATLRTSQLIDQIELMAKKEQNFSQNLVNETNKEKELKLIGESFAIQKVKEHIEIVAPSNLSILITGETGVGKEIVARMIHMSSSRSTKPLIYVNCAALSESLIESEIFGHVKGAFTGAICDRMGKFELANNGTLFLDEIGELPLAAQAKLLRVLQEGEVQKVGADHISKVNVRIIAATNRHLEVEKNEGRFRADLFHRLSVYPINVPPLRERKEDIPFLSDFFIKQFQRRLGTGEIKMSKECHRILTNYSWAGNVRELKNILDRAILTAKNRQTFGEEIVLSNNDFYLGPVVSISDLEQKEKTEENVRSFNKLPSLLREKSLSEATQEFQKVFIQQKLEENFNNWAKTAQTLGLHRSNFHNLGKKLGLKDQRKINSKQ